MFIHVKFLNCSLHSCSLKDPNKSRTFAKRKYTNIKRENIPI